MMQFYFDGTLVDSATNWQDVNTILRRDKNENIFLLFQEYTLEFADSGYEYIVDKVLNDSFCTQIDIDIYKDCGGSQTLIFSGIMFISDAEVDEQTCVVKVKVNDKSFFSKINNNKSIKTSLGGAFTKNKVPILAAEIYDLDVHSVVTNNLVRTVEACRIEEVFRYFIDFMSDNSVAFRSDTFGATGPWNGLCITTGERLRGVTPSVNAGRWQPFSFIDLFKEIDNRVPLVMLVEDPFNNPVLRIESVEYLYGSQVNYFAADIDKITTSFDTEQLYAAVKFGSPTDDTSILDFPEAIDFYGFKNEEFHLLSTCNLDRVLDLESKWVVSSNITQRVVASDQGYDKSTFLLNSIYTDDFTGRTTNDNFLGATPARYHYNALLNNASISDRYIDDFSASLAAFYVNSREGEAYAYRSAALVHSNPNANENFTGFLDVESYDFGNNFDTGTGLYTAPQAAAYNVKAAVTINFSTQAGTGFNWYQFLLEHYNAANVLINAYNIAPPNNTLGGAANIPGSYWVASYASGTVITQTLTQVINMAQGDYLNMRIRSYPDGVPQVGAVSGSALYNILAPASQTYLQIVDTSIAGGVVLDVDPDILKVQLHKFNYPMTQTDFDAIIANPVGRIAFAMNGQPYRFGWIKDLKYNHTSGLAEFTLTTNRNGS